MEALARGSRLKRVPLGPLQGTVPAGASVASTECAPAAAKRCARNWRAASTGSSFAVEALELRRRSDPVRARLSAGGLTRICCAPAKVNVRMLITKILLLNAFIAISLQKNSAV